MALQKAARTKATTVILSNGTEFTMQWSGDKFWLKPADGSLCPCGWFSIERIDKYVDAMLVVEEHG